MEIAFTREDNTNYLKISHVNQEKPPAYLIKMLSGNKIPGLLAVQDRTVNNFVEYYYDIKSYKPIASLYEAHDISVGEIVKILQCLDKSISGLDGYFLEKDGILLNPRCVMVDTEENKTYFAYIPGKKDVFEEELRRFIEFMLEHMEHSDRNKTIRFYEVYQDVIRGGSDIGEIIEKLTCKDIKRCQEHEKDEEYIVPSVMSERVEQEAEVCTFNSRKAAFIVKAAAVPVIAVAVLSQIFSGALPFDIPFFAAVSAAAVAAIAYVIGIKLESIPPSAFTKMITKEEEIPYSFSKSEYETYNESDADREQTAGSREYNAASPTMILSEAVRRKCVIELVSEDNNSEANIYIETLPCIIGSSPKSADAVIQNPVISRVHAKIDIDSGGTYFIQDMFSTNGTFVNKLRLAPEARQPLNGGDIITLASSSYKVVI